MLSSYEKKLLWILLFIFATGILLFGGKFLSMTSVYILANQLPEYGLISIAIMVTLIVSGMNLSIVAMTTLSGVLGAMLMEKLSSTGALSVLVGIVAMITIGIITGAINGIVISYVEVSPILATLGTMLIYSGLALNVTKGGAITSFDNTFTAIGSGSLFGIPIPFIIFIGVLLLIYYILNIHEYGLQLYRIGKDKNSAVYSGINVKKIVFEAYMIAGFIAGITAIVMTARYNSIRVDYGSSYLINGIVIVSLGGVDLKGGRGTIKGVMIALLIFSIMLRILNLAYVDSSLIEGIKGLLLLIIIVVQYFSQKKVNVFNRIKDIRE